MVEVIVRERDPPEPAPAVDLARKRRDMIAERRPRID
jgi:hypothetical protein